MKDLPDRLDRVRHRIAELGRDPDGIHIVAVTKGFGIDAIRAAVAAGLIDIGENRANELVAKAVELHERGGTAERVVRFHFVGQLQRNKVRAVAPYVALFQSVDRPALGAEIARRAPGAAVLVQVNLTDDPHRGGAAPGEVTQLVAELRELDLRVRGLMAVAAIGPPEVAAAGFRRVRALADELELGERSYGMTDDWEVAVTEGATMLRLGTALFGPRPADR
jgi:PLP dependent protein